MTFQQIKYLLEIYRTGSIAAAAHNLFLVPSSLSIAIGNLEQELDCQIFTRTKNGMIPTARGLEIIEYANKIYANYQLMTTPPKENQRRIIIAGNDCDEVNTAFVRMVEQFRSDKNLSFSKLRLSYKQLSEQIAAFQLDLGILRHTEAALPAVEAAMAAKGLRTTVLKRLPIAITIGPGHRLYDVPELTCRDFENDILIDRQDGIALHNHYINHLMHLQESRTLIVSSDRTRYQLAAKGIGFLVGPPRPRDIQERYGLRNIYLQDFAYVLILLENPNRPMHPAVAKYIEFLKEELDK